MPAGKLNLNIEQGATFHKSLSWKDSGGNPIDLTGYTAKMRIVAHGVTVIDLTTENGRIMLTPLEGKIDLKIAASDTDVMAFTAGVYDLKLLAGTEEIRLVEGNVYVSPSVTPRG